MSSVLKPCARRSGRGIALFMISDHIGELKNEASCKASVAGRGRAGPLVEYGLLLVLVSLGAVAAMGTLASAVSGAFGSASSNLSSS